MSGTNLNEAIANLESLISEDSAAKGVEQDANSSSDSEDEDESVKALKCTKCRKVYHTVDWLKRHEGNANENTAKKKAANVRASNENQSDSCRPGL